MEREELQQLIASAATLAAATILDNYMWKDDVETKSKGESNMASTRQRFHITLPNGEKVWLTGNTVADAFSSGLQKYGAMFSKPKEESTPEFGTYALEWLHTYKKPKLRQTTYRSYESQLTKHIIPFFKGKPVGTVTTADIQSFFNERGHLSKSSARQMRIILHEIFTGAIEDGYCSKDPTQSKRLSLPEKVTEREALSTSDFRDIISNLQNLKADDARLLALLMFTGMRRGEVLGLRWDDVDLEDGLIYVRRGVTFKSNQPIVGKTKSKAGIRSIPISHQLLPYLSQPEKGYIVGGGEEPITESTFDRAWQRIERTIDLHGATPHIFRHTYLTQLSSAGVAPKTIQAIAGHSDINITMNRYVHKLDEGILDAGKKFSELTFC